MQSNDKAAEKKGNKEEAAIVIRTWSRACVHGRGRTTQNHKDAARERTGRDKVAALLSHQLPAVAAEEKCRASGTVLTEWLCNRTTIPYDGTTISPTYNGRSRSCCTRRRLST